MRQLRKGASWLILLVAGLWPSASIPAHERVATPTNSPRASADRAGAKPSPIPFSELPASVRERVRKVVEQPRMYAVGTPEEFPHQRPLYDWFLDHPDRAGLAWRRLGATCVDIVDHGQGRFSASDGEGTEASWRTIHISPEMRVWFCEATAKPKPLLRAVPIEAVVVLHQRETRDAAGRPMLWHQGEVFLNTDSKSAIVMTKLFGALAPNMAEQSANQLQQFFSDLVRFVDRRPELLDRLTKK